jgi:hypothetical protein
MPVSCVPRRSSELSAGLCRSTQVSCSPHQFQALCPNGDNKLSFRCIEWRISAHGASGLARSASGPSALLSVPSVPYAGAVPDGGRHGQTAAVAVEPPSSSGLGHRPFKAAARVRIPLGALLAPASAAWSCRAARSARHPVKVEVAGSNPVRTARVSGATGPLGAGARPRSGSSVGMSVRLKSGRSAVRPRP